MKNAYLIIAGLFGILIFCPVWLIAISEWGLLVGLMAGWIPALIGGVVLGLLWPLTLAGIFWVISIYSLF